MRPDEYDLERMIEMEQFEQAREPELEQADQYGLDIECQEYRDSMKQQEIEQAINGIREDHQLDELKDSEITPIKDEVTITKLPDNTPEILYYLDDWGRRMKWDTKSRK